MTIAEELGPRIDRVGDLIREVESILQTVVLNDATIIDALAQMLGTIQQMNSRTAAREIALEQSNTVLTAEMRKLSDLIVGSHLIGRRDEQPFPTTP